VIRNTAHGASLSANPESNPAVPASRFLFAHNVFEGIGLGDYAGGRLFQIAKIHDLYIEHNTALSSHSAMILQGNLPMERFVVRNNVFGGTKYGVTGDGVGGGQAALDNRCAPGWIFSGNVLSGVVSSTYPIANYFASTTAGIGFVSSGTLDLRLAVTSPYVGILAGVSPGANHTSLAAHTQGVVVQ